MERLGKRVAINIKQIKNLPFFIIFGLCAVFQTTISYANSCFNSKNFLIGAGIYDITGPAAEVGMMGYGMAHQRTAGISQRQWARAFVIESPCNGKRIVFVNTDLALVFQANKEYVIKKLQAKYGKKYTHDNVVITATHTHSVPGGYSTYALYNLTTFGFKRDNFNAIVNGIVNAIERAEANIQPATIKIATGFLPNISYNRSPDAYLKNQASERMNYADNVDTEMTVLRFDSLSGAPIGMINWFPIHGVSLNNKNTLISGDNKGIAEYLFEKDFHSDYGPHAFVAAFAQSHAGDVSPNPYGQSGKCNTEGLIEAEKVGRAQYNKAKELYDNASTYLTGAVDFRHTFVAMNQIEIKNQYTDGVTRYTCPAAIGFSMLAGTQDGEGIGKQGITCSEVTNIFSAFLCELITTPCQREKPIVVSTGTKSPLPWTPQILPLQIMKIGNVSILAAPFELTTMSGRRLRNSVQGILKQDHVIIAGLSNAYAGYVVTNEEYALQRYEAASTHFGPWQQAALQQEFDKLATALLLDKPALQGPTPHDLLDEQVDLQPTVWWDDKPIGVNFGSLHQDVKTHYLPNEIVEVSFWGGHPNNNLRTQGSFLEIQQFINNQWKAIRYDRDLDTEYHWIRNGVSYSIIKIIWRIPANIDKGTYRIVHYGDWKSGWTKEITAYTGYSSAFMIN